MSMAENLSGDFSIVIPEPDPDISAMANMVLRLACLPEQLALEERTNVNHRTGRAENVAEHSLMLAIVAPALAARYYQQLDPNLIARYATIHDILEAYTGDTPTHDFRAVDHNAKEANESRALTQIAQDFHDLPDLIKLIQEYAAQEVPEARFVRVADKLMPLLIHFQDRGSTLKIFTSSEQLLSDTSARNSYLRERYPEFIEIVQLREELTKLAAIRLLITQNGYWATIEQPTCN